MHDLVIINGTVVDGTGSAPQRADVAVTDGVITEVGDRIVGRAHATDDSPPLTGTMVFEFDVAKPE